MRVTIVTPSYNQAQFLEETILSVLNQGWADLEYFVIDGSSSDASVQIIQKYAARLTDWISEQDHGQAEAINKGLQRATGEIVAWINSDDYYLPGAIERAVRVFEQNPQAGLVYGDVLSIDAQGQNFNLQTFQPYTLLDLMSFQIISQPAVFMRRDVLLQAGLLDPDYHYLLDHQLWLRMARSPMVYLPETLAAARYHAGAKNLAHTAEFGKEAFKIIDWMKENPDLAPIFSKNKARVLAGAHRFNAFYLLDGGEYAGALIAYWHAFWHRPTVVIKDWHRVGYAKVALIAKLTGLLPVLQKLRNHFKQKRHQMNKK